MANTFTITLTEKDAALAYFALGIVAKLGPGAQENPEIMARIAKNGPESLLRLAAMLSVSDDCMELANRIRKASDPTWEPLKPGETCPDCGEVHEPAPKHHKKTGPKLDPESPELPDNVIRFPGPETKQ